MISASLSPNTEFDDVFLALRTLLTPWVWGKGSSVGKVEGWFRQYLHTSRAVSFNSGRSAFLAILKAFDVGRGDEVMVQAFTCVAVPNSVLWTGAKPVYADIDETYNIDPNDVRRKISPKTKAIVVQHTFGVPAKIEEILEIAKRHKLIVIEDCAHSLGTGRIRGDAAFFSFGRDKVISSVFGGVATIHSMHDAQCRKLKEYHKKLNTPSFRWIFQQLFHPVAFSIILSFYRLGIGKVLLVILQRLRLLSFPVYPEEKLGHQPADFPAKYPNALAILLLKQLKKLERFTKQREEIVKLYGGEARLPTPDRRDGGQGPLLRFPLRVESPEKTIEKAKKKGILLGNWYHNVVDPAGVDFAAVGYKKSSCPRAEDAARHIINLPTRISLREAKRALAAL